MNNEIIKSIIFALSIIVIYLISIFLIKDKMTIDSIMYLKYLH
jgi:hypothetical protein